MFTVYLLRSVRSGKFYVGITSDLNDRLKRHNANRSHATKGKGPWIVVYSEAHSDRPSAREREKFFKSGMGRRILLEMGFRGGPAKKIGG